MIVGNPAIALVPTSNQLVKPKLGTPVSKDGPMVNRNAGNVNRIFIVSVPMASAETELAIDLDLEDASERIQPSTGTVSHLDSTSRAKEPAGISDLTIKVSDERDDDV